MKVWSRPPRVPRAARAPPTSWRLRPTPLSAHPCNAMPRESGLRAHRASARAIPKRRRQSVIRCNSAAASRATRRCPWVMKTRCSRRCAAPATSRFPRPSRGFRRPRLSPASMRTTASCWQSPKERRSCAPPRRTAPRLPTRCPRASRWRVASRIRAMPSSASPRMPTPAMISSCATNSSPRRTTRLAAGPTG